MKPSVSVIVLISVFLCYASISKAQNEDYFKSDHLKIAPLSWLNLWLGPNANIIHEHFFKSEKITSALNTTIGVHFPSAYLNWNKLYGAFVKEEVRWYSIPSGLFLGFEIAGGYQTFLRTDSLEVGQNLTYNSKRAWLEAGFNLGGSIPFDNGFMFEIYFSVGGRYYDNNVGLSDQEASGRYWGDWTNPRYYREEKGKHFAPKITMNCKISLWKFRASRKKKSNPTQTLSL
jgi:hypothetical protein